MKRFFQTLPPFKATLLLILATTLVRIAASINAELTTDEAHYALYGYHLDWSYFDHPSLIGWLQALMLNFSSSELAMRFIPLLLFAAASVVLYKLSVKLFPNESRWLGFVSVALMQSAVMLQLIGMAMLPDSPLLLLGLLVVWVLHDIVKDGQAGKNTLRYWLWLGLLLGLAGISKYTAVTLVLTVLLALHFGRKWRQVLSPGPWLAVIVAGVVILPVLYWNYKHEWLSILFQLHHGTAKLDWQFKRLIISQAGQLIVYGPLLFGFGWVALVSGLKRWGALAQAENHGTMLLLAAALPLLLLFAWNSGYEMTLPHWTSFGWLVLAPLTARWLIKAWHKRWLRNTVYVSAAYSVLLNAAILGQLISPWLPFAENNNPLKDLYGWKAAAQHAAALRGEMNMVNPDEAYIFVENWTQGSRLGWYARPAPIMVLDDKINQFDIWFGSPKNNMRGILVLWPGETAQPETGGPGHFAKCALHDRMPVKVKGRVSSTFSFYACEGYQLKD